MNAMIIPLPLFNNYHSINSNSRVVLPALLADSLILFKSMCLSADNNQIVWLFILDIGYRLEISVRVVMLSFFLVSDKVSVNNSILIVNYEQRTTCLQNWGEFGMKAIKRMRFYPCSLDPSGRWQNEKMLWKMDDWASKVTLPVNINKLSLDC